MGCHVLPAAPTGLIQKSTIIPEDGIEMFIFLIAEVQIVPEVVSVLVVRLRNPWSALTLSILLTYGKLLMLKRLHVGLLSSSLSLNVSHPVRLLLFPAPPITLPSTNGAQLGLHLPERLRSPLLVMLATVALRTGSISTRICCVGLTVDGGSIVSYLIKPPYVLAFGLYLTCSPMKNCAV